MRTEILTIFVFRNASRSWVKFVDSKRFCDLYPPPPPPTQVIYATDLSTAVAPMLFLLFGFVVYYTWCFMFSLALRFVLVFLQSF